MIGILARPRNKRYLLRDLFSTNQAAPLNGRLAQPGPGGVVAYRDVENKISIVGGVETWAAQATPVFAEQDRVYAALPVTRAFGVVVIAKWRLTTDNPVYPLALVTSTTPAWNHTNVEAGFFRSAALSLAAVYNATLGPVVATIATDTDYLLAIELRAAGAIWKIKGGAFTNWMTLFAHTLGSTATLYVASAGYTAVFLLDDVRLPSRLFKDVPLASDSFVGADGTMTGRVTDGLGHPEANGGGGLAWATPGNTWTIASNAAVNTPTLGSDLITNGNMSSAEPPGTAWTRGADWTIAAGIATKALGTANAITQAVGATGNWYQVTFDLTWIAGIFRVIFGGATTGAQRTSSNSYLDTNRAAGTFSGIGTDATANGSIDNVVTKQLTLASLFSSLVLSTVNVMAECVIKTLVAGTQAGGVARLDNATTPANFIIYYEDGTGNIKVDECVAGVYTNLLNVVKAHATGDKLQIWLNGSAYRLYHVTSAGVVTLQGSGTTNVTTGNLFGNFSTFNGNAIESCKVDAVGVEGQYDGMNLL